MIKQLLVLGAAGASSLILAAAAQAQTGTEFPAPAANPDGLNQSESASSPAVTQRAGIEEIVVTARKREESIQSVPLAVTAVSGEALERANVTDVSALSTQVPSLVIVPSSSGSASIPTFAIRGQSQQEQSIIADPSVPIYFNDIAVQRPHGVNQAMYDLQTVEVLKGPQGTLFGRNSTGGAVVVRANRPGTEFDGYVGVTVGSYGRFNTTGMVNQPLTDWAQIRFAGQTTDSDGYISDVLLGSKVNTEHTKAGRLSLAIQPLDGLDSVFTYSRYIEDNGGSGAHITRLHPNSLAYSGGAGHVGPYSGTEIMNGQRDRGMFKLASGLEQYSRVSTWDFSNTTTYDLTDSISIKNVAGWRQVDSETMEDVDGSAGMLMHINRIAEFKQFSEEFQVMGSTDTLNWIAGVYYFNESGGSNDYSNAPGIAPTLPPNSTTPIVPVTPPRDTINWNLTSPFGENTSKSVFAQITQKLDPLLDGLSVTVGARYTWDEREARIRSRRADTANPGEEICRVNQTNGTPFPIDQCDFRFKKDFSEPTWNISLDYQYTSDNLVYLANRRGYRTGGFGARATTVEGLSRTFDAETVTDFELGSKNTFYIADMPLRVNVAVFYADYTDIQRLLTVPNTTPPQTVPVNAGEATIKGGEFEFTFMPTDRIELSGFYSYTDAGYDEFVDPSSGADLSGQPFARAPENVYSLTARYSLPVSLALGDASVQATWFHTDGYSTSDSYAPEQSVDSYGILNLRADLRRAFGSNVDVGLSLNNALDEEYLVSFGDLYTSTALGFVSRVAGAPRTIGVDLRYRFGASGN